MSGGQIPIGSISLQKQPVFQAFSLAPWWWLDAEMCHFESPHDKKKHFIKEPWSFFHKENICKNKEKRELIWSSWTSHIFRISIFFFYFRILLASLFTDHWILMSLANTEEKLFFFFWNNISLAQGNECKMRDQERGGVTLIYVSLKSWRPSQLSPQTRLI